MKLYVNILFVNIRFVCR